MKIAVAGTGYVGLVTGVCLADKGHNVTCVDVDTEKIEKMKNGTPPFFEPDLETLMAKNSERLRYTTDFRSAYSDAEVIFIGVGTPEKKDGSANLSYVFEVAQNIADSVTNDCVVVVKSTVPIGTNDRVEKLIKEKLVNPVNIYVVSNPEFLAQGTAIRDTMHSSRIVVGVQDDYSRAVMKKVYADFDAPLLLTDRRSAEMIKYASNDFLALKVSYINEIANLCEMVGANIEDVSTGMGYDTRIGKSFLRAGIGYGGSCFPKDTKALDSLATINGYELKTVKAAIEVNEVQKLMLIRKAKKYYESLEGLTVAVLGLTFKPGTDDLREAPSLVNIPILLDDGAAVRAWDPIGAENFKKLYPTEIEYCETVTDALKGADICFIFTEWKQVTELTPEEIKVNMRHPIVMDGRNCLSADIMNDADISYNGIGR